MSDNKTTITTNEDYNMKIVEWIGQVDIKSRQIPKVITTLMIIRVLRSMI